MYKHTTLREQAIALLDNRPARLTLEKIAEDCNVSTAWLRLLRKGRIENPGVCTIEEIIKYMSNYTPKA